MRSHGSGTPVIPPLTGDEKPASTLARADFERCPVWEFSHTIKKEMWVRPAAGLAALPRGRYALQVACDIRLADGTMVPGWADITTVAGCEVSFLMVFGAESVATLPLDEATVQDREAITTGLVKSAKAIFPLQYTLRLPMEGETAPISRSLP